MVNLAPKARAARADSIQESVKDMVWSLSSRLGLHGLCPMDIEDRWMMVSRQRIDLPSLGAEFEGTRVVHISDLHFSPLMRERHLERYVEIINDAEPDFVTITGDFITASARHYARRAGEVLRGLSPRIATLACLGNHDYGIWKPGLHQGVRGLASYLTGQLEKAGIVPLVNESQIYRRGNSTLQFVGLADLWASDCSMPRAFASIAPARPVIALSHNPDSACRLADGGADLVLSGHTHGRAIGTSPIQSYLFPVEYRRFVAGHYPLGEGRHLYVNRGVGHARRIGRDRRPEITLLTLRQAAPAAGRRAEAAPAV